jgi:class 3 adenylate cyclase/tetratricopeptide (TPR) repeat protein
MRCEQCQQENPAGAKFCNSCGARMSLACPACGQPNRAGSRFCSECGQALGDLAESPTPQRFSSPRAYTPGHLAEKILGSRSALEGERKQVTVLFADIKGSMELLADLDPEIARKLLDPVLERMMEAVHLYEGTVNQVMGDGIMALFGAPVAHEDHAVRACYAALRMQDSVTRYGDEIQRSHGAPLQIRIGLNSGEVVVRSVGSDLRMDYTAVGQTAHLGARMEQMAKPGSILVTADTLRLAEGYVEARSLGPAPVKGLAHPVEVFEIVKAGATRTRLQARAAGGLTRFVGRDAELDQLRGTLDRVRASQGQVLALVGEAGVGKSRLIWEVVHSHRTDGWLVLESSAVSYGKAIPYFPVLDLLKAYFRIEERDDSRTIREKVAGKLMTLDAAFQPAIPIFFSLLDVPGDDPAWARLDAAERGRQTREAIKRLLLRESQVQPVLLIVEDLHWIDPDTQALLNALVEGLPAARVSLLVNYRPEYRHEWSNKTYYGQLRLDPLPPERADVLLHALVGGDRALDPLCALLIQRTQGNPFFLEESILALVETGVLAGARGAYRLARPVETLQMPATVQAMLAARIDRLAQEDKHLLQTAAVVGMDVPAVLLEAVSDLPDQTLRGGLARLQGAELLYETRLFPDVAYTFKHALTHEVAYGSLLSPRRRALHERVLEAIERLYPDRLTEQADRLAHHAFRGEVWGKALRYLRQAGVEASQWSLDAVDAVTGGAESAGKLWWTGQHERALKVSQRDLAVAADFGNYTMRVASSFRLGQAHHSLGSFPPATDVFRRTTTLVQGDLSREFFGMAGLPSVFARSWLAWSLAEQGAFDEALGHAKDALEIAEAADHAFTLIVAAWGVGVVHLLRGDAELAVPAIERGLVVERTASIPNLVPFVGAPLGAAYTLAGRLADGKRLLEQAVERAEVSRLTAGQALRLTWLGEAEAAAERIESASSLAGRALDLARTTKERAWEAYALRLLGEITARRGPAERAQAEATLREALAIADELGMRPFAARCRLDLGLLLAASDRTRAGAELSRAAEALGAMGMSVWKRRADEALASVA